MKKCRIGMTTAMSNLGEGFAFFHWMVNVIYPKTICDSTMGGWACRWCRERWQRTKDKDEP